MYQELAVAIDGVARELARSVPAPREAPYFGLDGCNAYDLRVLDALLAHGIFRKYEFALDLGSGLGGRARWLAARSGCRVLGVDPRPSVVAAAALLNRRARIGNQVMFQVGHFGALPLRDCVFTHVWLVDAHLSEDAGAALAEAYRVLRRGGHFALQSAPAPAGETLRQLLRDVGFVELAQHDVTFADPPHAYQIAAQRLRQTLRHGGVEADWQEHLATRRERGGIQIFGRRPA